MMIKQDHIRRIRFRLVADGQAEDHWGSFACRLVSKDQAAWLGETGESNQNLSQTDVVVPGLKR